MKSRELMKLEDEFTSNVYSKRPVVIVRGKGALVWDVDGNEYVDCLGGHGVGVIGHSNPMLVEAIKKQIDKIIVCPCTLYNDVRARYAEKLVEATPRPLNKVFFCNSGTESVELAFKLARKFTGKKEMIAMTKSFHGRTFGSLSATWKPKYRKPFEPLVPGFNFAKFGDFDAVKDIIDDNTAAVIVEPVQGEGGVHAVPDGYLEKLRDLCDENKVVLIFDEVQSGFGRTGKLFAFQHWGVVPDILCIAKGIAGGVPLGVTIAREEVMNTLEKGEHGSTFGGNPLSCAAALAALDFVVSENLPKRAESIGKYFKAGLEGLQRKYRIVRDVRGLGLMLGMELRFSCKDILFAAVKKGVLLLPAGRNVIRFLPPLVIEKEQVERVISVLDELCEENENKFFKEDP